MKFVLKGHNYKYEVQSTAQIFFKNSTFDIVENVNMDEVTIFTEINEDYIKASIYIDSLKKIEFVEKYTIDEKENIYKLKRAIFLTLKEYTGFIPEWGMFTGIRPIKRINQLISSGYSEDEITQLLTNRYFLSEEKIRISINIAKNQSDIIKDVDEHNYSLYINIPFCYSKCSYCSFTSFSYDKYHRQNDVSKYLEYLLKEIEYTHTLLNGKILKSIYIGGGTPTSLSESELKLLLDYLYNKFDVFSLEEYTIEAGRPDTITKEKLEIMKDYGVSRISINAQTLNNNTLKKINRRHTVSEFYEIYKIAREVGHNNINVDIIVGLEDETYDDVKRTVEGIIKLNPENITVHTLAIKKGSKIKENMLKTNITYSDEIDYNELKSMLDISYNLIMGAGYNPYYLYRQKNMRGNLENIGFSNKNNYGYYNIHIMEEKQSIIAVGAGASSKIVNINNNHINTVFNFKGVEEYMLRFEEILCKKKGMYNVK